ncbi:hypothetical protein Taro_037271 [Colocasia esculenta]|uniref:RNase H type-1 domain-containing protein n=1 Tax=Colocasia esculenta TaxID=4460 RepID=A0A843W591_COLES|nr:hypothetical protein [Colocasia esculenta]
MFYQGNRCVLRMNALNFGSFFLSLGDSDLKPGHVKSECPEVQKKTQPRWNKNKQKAMVGTWSEEEEDEEEESLDAKDTHSKICLMAIETEEEEEEGWMARHMFFSAIWEIWCSRNRSRFDDQPMVARKILQRVMMHVSNSQKITNLRFFDLHASHLSFLQQWGITIQMSAPVAPKIVRWYLPPPGRLKLNVDGAYKSTSSIAAGGGVLRNELGDIVLAFAASYQGVYSSLEAEALALGMALYCVMKGAYQESHYSLAMARNQWQAMQETMARLTQALQNVVQAGAQAEAQNGAGDLHCNFRS